MTSWLDYYPCGIEMYGKNIQDICKIKQNVTDSSLVLAKTEQLYKNGYIETFDNALNTDFFRPNFFKPSFFIKKAFFIFIIFFLLYNIK